MSLPPTIAIVGRPNVGKSTLFNRLAGKRLAVVHETPGVTRDRLATMVERNSRRFYFVDTGGITMDRQELHEKTRDSALAALEDAGLLLFMVDVRTGITDEDLAVAKLLRRHGERVWLLVNKVERAEDELVLHDFHSLGLGNPLAISALHGEGIGELWERLEQLFPEQTDPEAMAKVLRLAIVGRPNVGKSSIANALLGEERMIVSDLPGTTRDAVDTRIKWHGKEISLIDTAGLRRKRKVKERLEIYSNLRSLSAIDRCDVVLLVLDAERGFAEQDLKIAGHAHDEGRGMVIVVNKWDLVKKNDGTLGEMLLKVREKLPFLSYAPVLFISALTHQRIHKVLETAWRVYEERSKVISTPEINDFIAEALRRNPPKFHQKGTGKIYYGTQYSSRPPSFMFFVNKEAWFPTAYLRYLTNRLRERFGFEGNPIRLKLKGRKKNATAP